VVGGAEGPATTLGYVCAPIRRMSAKHAPKLVLVVTCTFSVQDMAIAIISLVSACAMSALIEERLVHHVESIGMALIVKHPAIMVSLPSRMVVWHVSVTLGTQAWIARLSVQEVPANRATGKVFATKVSTATAPVNVSQATYCLIVVWNVRVGLPTPAPAMVIAVW